MCCRVAGDVIAGVITKCLNARPKTKEKGIEIILMYIEVEKQDVVQVRDKTIETLRSRSHMTSALLLGLLFEGCISSYVWSYAKVLLGLDHALEVIDLLQIFLHSKTPQSLVW